MLPEELKQLIEKYCQGLTPTPNQENEINEKVFELGADPMEVFDYIEAVKKMKSKAELDAEEAERRTRQEEARQRAEVEAQLAARAVAQAEEARAAAEEAKANAQLHHEKRIEKKNKKRTYIVSAAVLIVLLAIGTIVYLNLMTGKSAAELAAEAAYNAKNNVSIDDISIDTSDIPSDDPSVVIDPSKEIKKQLEAHYETVMDLNAGFYKIKDHGKYGLADPSGKVIQRPKYDAIMSKNAQGLIRVTRDGKIGFLNLKGVEVVTPKYTKIEEPAEGLMKVEIDGLYGFLDAKTLKEVTPCIYSFIYKKIEGKYKVMQGNKVGYLNADGSVFQTPQ